MSDHHDDLLDTYEAETDEEIIEAREDTLAHLRWSTMQSLASEAGVYTQNAGRPELRRRLAVEGYFVGGVGDNSVYRYDDEAGRTVDTGTVA